MIITVAVEIKVKPDFIEQFVQASLENARNTIREPGNLRFDVIQQLDEPTRFMLYEAWRDEAGMNAHKETPHYALWRDTVADWMAEPRKGTKHRALFPSNPDDWNVTGE